jgi:hypothetical protein
MTQDELVSAVKDLAVRTNARIGDLRWYVFGSAPGHLSAASDIDLLVICQTHMMADVVRQVVDLDQFGRPIHLSILTKVEEEEVGFVESQRCVQVI